MEFVIINNLHCSRVFYLFFFSLVSHTHVDTHTHLCVCLLTPLNQSFESETKKAHAPLFC